MGNSTKLDLNLAADAGGAYIRQSTASDTTNQPKDLGTFVGFTSAEGIVSFPTIKKELDFALYLKILGGYDTLSGTTVPRSSPLSGPFDRAYYLLSRANIVGNNFGIYEFFLEAKVNTPGLTMRAGLAPQELFVYPYHFNSASCAVGDDKWTCSTSRSNPHDNTVWTNPYTSFIGPLVNLEWQPPFFSDLKFDLQTATDFVPPFNAINNEGNFKRWITTAQAYYSKGYQVKDIPFLTSLAFFYSHDKPAFTQNDKGEGVSPTHAIGLYALQSIESAKLAVGYGFNTNGVSGQDFHVTNRVHSVNLSLNYSLLKSRLILNGSFAWLGFSSEEKSLIVENPTKGNEYTVDLSATGALVKGLSATLGWNGFWADPSQAIVGGLASRHALYLFANYNFSHSWGGG